MVFAFDVNAFCFFHQWGIVAFVAEEFVIYHGLALGIEENEFAASDTFMG